MASKEEIEAMKKEAGELEEPVEEGRSALAGGADLEEQHVHAPADVAVEARAVEAVRRPRDAAVRRPPAKAELHWEELEAQRNPRARSAVLRWGCKWPGEG